MPAAIALLLLTAAGGPSAQPVGEPPHPYEDLLQEFRPGAKLLRLSLQDCIAAALKNNLDIEVERYFPRINDAVVQSQKGVFDPHLYFNATYINGTFPLPTSISVATGGLTAVETQQWLMSGGITGAIPTGLTYDANIASEHTPFSTITDFFGTNGEQRFETSLTVTQPLLKNFGIDVNTTGIRVAAKNKEASVYQLEQRMLETLFEVEQAYWELVFAYEDLSVKRQSLLTVQNLLDENRIRLKVGVIAPLAVLQSEVGVAVREQEVIVAESAVEDARDRLIKTTNLLPEQLLWDVEIVPIDEPSAVQPTEYVQDDEIFIALKNRPELKLLLKQQEAAELGARFAKNQLLPTLDLNASVGLIGLDEDFDTSTLPLFLLGIMPQPQNTGIDPAFDDLFSGENFQWMVGITFEIPWGNRFERGEYRKANLLVSQLDAGIRNLRQLIIQDTRNALRGIETDWERVLTTRQTTLFRRESLEAERKKYDVGVATTHDLLEFEEELAAAEANEERAIIDYTLSLSNLLRATGTLLKFRNVQVAADS